MVFKLLRRTVAGIVPGRIQMRRVRADFFPGRSAQAKYNADDKTAQCG